MLKNRECVVKNNGVRTKVKTPLVHGYVTVGDRINNPKASAPWRGKICELKAIMIEMDATTHEEGLDLPRTFFREHIVCAHCHMNLKNVSFFLDELVNGDPTEGDIARYIKQWKEDNQD